VWGFGEGQKEELAGGPESLFTTKGKETEGGGRLPLWGKKKRGGGSIRGWKSDRCRKDAHRTSFQRPGGGNLQKALLPRRRNNPKEILLRGTASKEHSVDRGASRFYAINERPALRKTNPGGGKPALRKEGRYSARITREETFERGASGKYSISNKGGEKGREWKRQEVRRGKCPFKGEGAYRKN